MAHIIEIARRVAFERGKELSDCYGQDYAEVWGEAASRYAGSLKDLQNKYMELQSRVSWIPVSEFPHQQGEEVLCANREYEKLFIATYEGAYGWRDLDNCPINVTHCMPLPEKP